MTGPVRLLLTRPEAQSGDWAQRMAALGVPTASLPLIEIAASEDPEPARRAWHQLAEARVVMFVSPNAVDAFFAQRPNAEGEGEGGGGPLPWPARTLAATVGPGSARALEAQGVPASQIVQPPPDAPSLDSEHLWPELQRVAGPDWSSARALLVRGDGGREWLGDRLREAGAQVDAISVYHRRCPTLDGEGQALLRTALQQPDQHVWLFSSAEAIGHLETLVARLNAVGAPRLSPESGTRALTADPTTWNGDAGPALPSPWPGVRAIATHERIAARARRLGLAHVVLVRPDAAAVATAFRGLSGATLESPR